MRPFDYQAPESLNEAVALLTAGGDRARPIAGGTDLLIQLRSGRYDFDLIVDIKRIPEMNQLSFSPSSGLTIGAALPLCKIYEDSQVAANYPALIDAISKIGSVAVQGRATIGGNLCNAAPSGDSIPTMIVLRATCEILGPNGNRTIPVEHFCTGPGRTVLTRGEVLVSLHFPPPQANSGAHYLRFIPRNEMDIAVVGAGASVVLTADRSTIVEARVALGVVAPTPVLVPEAGAVLAGRVISDEIIGQAAVAAQEAVHPRDTYRGTAAQRRHLVGVLTKRALMGAISRARGGEIDVR